MDDKIKSDIAKLPRKYRSGVTASVKQEDAKVEAGKRRVYEQPPKWGK
jgi:hypothetical protein